VLLSESRFDAQLRQLGLIENTTNSVSALNLRPTDLAVDLTQEEKAVSIAPLMLTVERALVGESKIELEPFSRLRGRDCRRCLAMAAQIGFGFSMKLDARDAFNLLRMVRAIFFVLFLLLLASLVLCSNPSAAAAH